MKVSENVIQNLRDAGCPEETIERFRKTSDETVQMGILNSYRKQLLGQVHLEQKKLQNLDYLIFTVKNNKNGGNV